MPIVAVTRSIIVLACAFARLGQARTLTRRSCLTMCNSQRKQSIDRLFAILLFVGFATTTGTASEPNERDLKRRFAETVSPFLNTYCFDCHGQERQETKLNLSGYSSVEDVAKAHKTWEIVLERLEAQEMPPEASKKQPKREQTQVVIEWIRTMREFEAQRNAGDPGIVLARRLSNAEYNYTIRDLTGVDIRPTATFPVDPANEAGFDNSGESLAMSPALLKKYLGAARQVVEHLVLKPEGFAFAPHPVVTDTDRDKYCVKRIVQFYERQPTDYAEYFLAAWRFKYRTEFGNEKLSLDELAKSNDVSAKYLATIRSTLVESKEDVGPIAKLQTMWSNLPEPRGEASADEIAKLERQARAGCSKMRDFVVNLRSKLEPTFDNLFVEGNHKGSQTFVLWKNRQYEAHRMEGNLDALIVMDESKATNGANSDLIVPADEKERSRYEDAFKRFCAIFPDAFYISERGRDYLGEPKEKQEKGRLLSAGFHSMMGYFRDDGPLYQLILDKDEQRELDMLWQELDFVTSAPMRQYAGFLWFERTDSRFMRGPEFDFARAEDKDALSESKIEKLSQVYLAKAKRNGGGDVEINAIADYFRNINDQIRWVESARLKAENSHLDALLVFAERAYRRKLSASERQEILAFYRQLRENDGLGHEDAIQDTIVSILMSPFFCYRIDLAGAGEKQRPLSDFELASRLSYFLWSSMPDQRLLERADRGELHRPDVLVAETKRMMRDDRIRGLATEFAGNWLDFRHFEEHNSVDRERFPKFTDELRKAMFEEPILFFIDVVQNDRSVIEFLEADHTFVNAELAKHYGIDELEFEGERWIRVDNANQFNRGGLLPMSVFLTKNAPGLRTSPVKRGYWVVRRVLGERIPPPPPNVPELPNDESKLGDLTLREVLAKHRDHKSCGGCHERFDSIGLAFESYGPVGEQRSVDLGGRAVSTFATFPGGHEAEGIDGLRAYLLEHRQQEFVDNLCRKMLSYALGRTLQLSDNPLISEMQEKLKANDHRFSSLIVSIVTSPQFLNKRGDQLVKE